MAQFSGYRTKDDLLADIKPYTSAKRVKHNTFDIQYVDGSSAIRYQDTDVITWHNGHIILDSGGFKTMTTKSRINEYLPSGLTVYQHQSVWYLGKPGDWDMKHHDIFTDRMKIDAATLEVVSPKIDMAKRLQKVKAMKARIKKFVSKLDNGVPLPSSGDCWYCAMHDKDGVSWGDRSKDDDHILKHVLEGYMHGSLVLNALQEKGYGDPRFVLQMAHERPELVFVDDCKRALTRYLQRRLLPK